MTAHCSNSLKSFVCIATFLLLLWLESYDSKTLIQHSNQQESLLLNFTISDTNNSSTNFNQTTTNTNTTNNDFQNRAISIGLKFVNNSLKVPKLVYAPYDSRQQFGVLHTGRPFRGMHKLPSTEPIKSLKWSLFGNGQSTPWYIYVMVLPFIMLFVLMLLCCCCGVFCLLAFCGCGRMKGFWHDDHPSMSGVNKESAIPNLDSSCSKNSLIWDPKSQMDTLNMYRNVLSSRQIPTSLASLAKTTTNNSSSICNNNNNCNNCNNNENNNKDNLESSLDIFRQLRRRMSMGGRNRSKKGSSSQKRSQKSKKSKKQSQNKSSLLAEEEKQQQQQVLTMMESGPSKLVVFNSEKFETQNSKVVEKTDKSRMMNSKLRTISEVDKLDDEFNINNTTDSKVLEKTNESRLKSIIVSDSNFNCDNVNSRNSELIEMNRIDSAANNKSDSNRIEKTSEFDSKNSGLTKSTKMSTKEKSNVNSSNNKTANKTNNDNGKVTDSKAKTNRSYNILGYFY